MNTDESTQAQREKDTGLAMILIFLLFLYFTEKMIFVLPAIATLVFTMTWPKIFRPVSFVWFGLSKVIGDVVSKVLLTLVFSLVAVPIGFVRRLMGADSMKLKQWKKENDTYFTDKEQKFSAADLNKPY